MENAEEFIELYKLLEKTIREKYNLNEWDSPIEHVKKKNEFAQDKYEIGICQKVRNLFSHEPKFNEDYLVDPSLKLIDFLKKLIRKIENPPTAFSLSTKRSDILFASRQDNVIEVMEEMVIKNFTHIPILENDVVIGVFGESTIFNYISKNGGIALEKSNLFNNLLDYVGIKSHSERFEFVKRSESYHNIKKKYLTGFKDGKRLGMLFVTENGLAKEKLIGIITLWDVLNYDI